MKCPSLPAGRGNPDGETAIIGVRFEVFFGLIALGLQGV
jgi:hypothetical protein